MKFLVDAQLPRRFASLLNRHGHDALHTLNLPGANRTTDQEIMRFADLEQRVVITKDADFVHSFHLDSQPKKLLLISTGNISNVELDVLIISNLAAIVDAFQSGAFVEMTRATLIVHY